MIKYCKRCLYPSNSKPTIIFDDEGICSGCRYHENRKNLEINWDERKKILDKIIDDAIKFAKKNNNSYHCIIPVSGGKDSTFQVWYLKKNYGINPLLVSFNHCFNTRAGNANLKNLLEKSGCDFIRFTAGINSVRKISRYMLEKVGDITWHYHAGIRTFPMKIAAEKRIPLVIWGEHGFGELTGLVSINDFVEYTKWSRLEHDMRGVEAETLIGHNDIQIEDIDPYRFPDDKEVINLGLRGIYLGNFIDWDQKKNTEIVQREWNFKSIRYKRDRTFNLFAKIEDHANDIHDYMKFLKFGYGRATDDVSMEIRRGRITREEGKKIVEEYDHKEPSALENYCEFLGITKNHFYKILDTQRDETIWKKNENKWIKKTSFENEKIDSSYDKAKVKMSNDHVFNEKNKNMFYNSKNTPELLNDENFDKQITNFEII
tara:strand:+ start:1144 stop:2436 length:1293 start_codon:yes stop_codon:yes gene_type:complete